MCATQGFDICAPCKMISIVSLVNTHHLAQLHNFFLVMRTFKVSCLSSLQMCTRVLLAIVTMPYINISRHDLLITPFTHFPTLHLLPLLEAIHLFCSLQLFVYFQVLHINEIIQYLFSV